MPMAEDKAHADAGQPAGDFTQSQNPFALFETWFGEATRSEPSDANAMGLATVDASGLPNLRIVLLKGLDGPDIPPAALFSIPMSKAPKAASC